MNQPTRNLPHPAAPATRATLASAMVSAGLPGAVTVDGAVAVDTVEALNAWYVRFRTGSALSVVSRSESRGGRMVSVGGLDWRLTVRGVPGVGDVTVRSVSAEMESLPNLAVAQAGYPYGIRTEAVQGVAA